MRTRSRPITVVILAYWAVLTLGSIREKAASIAISTFLIFWLIFFVKKSLFTIFNCKTAIKWNTVPVWHKRIFILIHWGQEKWAFFTLVTFILGFFIDSIFNITTTLIEAIFWLVVKASVEFVDEIVLTMLCTISPYWTACLNF